MHVEEAPARTPWSIVMILIAVVGIVAYALTGGADRLQTPDACAGVTLDLPTGAPGAFDPDVLGEGARECVEARIDEFRN